MLPGNRGHLLAPGLQTTSQGKDGTQPQRLQLLGSLRAADTAGAVHQVCFGSVELFGPAFKLSRFEIDVDGPGQCASGNFCWSAHVQQDSVDFLHPGAEVGWRKGSMISASRAGHEKKKKQGLFHDVKDFEGE